MTNRAISVNNIKKAVFYRLNCPDYGIPKQEQSRCFKCPRKIRHACHQNYFRRLRRGEFDHIYGNGTGEEFSKPKLRHRSWNELKATMRKNTWKAMQKK